MSKNQFDVEAYILGCTEAERAAIGGLMFVRKGLAQIDLTPAINKETGEEVIGVAIIMMGCTLVVGHISKTSDAYEPLGVPERKAA